MPNAPSISTQKSSQRAAHPRPSHQKWFSQGPREPSKSSQAWSNWLRAVERRVPHGGENFTKSQRRLGKSYSGRGLMAVLQFPTAWLAEASHLLGTAIGQPLLAVAIKTTGASARGPKGKRCVGLTEKPSASFGPFSNSSPMMVRRGPTSQGCGDQDRRAGAPSAPGSGGIGSQTVLPQLLLPQKEGKVSVASLPSF